MNNTKRVLILFVLFFSVLSKVYAYSSDLYEIEIPENYIKENEMYVLKEEDNITNIYVNTEENKEKINISNYKSSNLKVLEDQFKKKINTKDVTINSIKSHIDNDYKYSKVIIDINMSYTFDDKKTNVYQREYILSSKNYIYYINISSSSLDKLNSKEISDIVNSFIIKDEAFKINLNNYLILMILIISSILLLYVLRKKGNK